MLSWLAKKMIARNMERASAGDIEPTLKMDHKDVHFRFPGDSSWAGEIKGKEQLRPWLQRFADAGIAIYPDEVVLQGFPWRQTICIRGRDHLDTPTGERVYENRYVIWGHLRWGLLRDYEVYEDTQRAKQLDGYLASVGKL
jgi:ketosteroid isomerase-like protein